MRRVLIAMAVLLVWPEAAFAANLVVEVPIDEYRETKNKLDGLQKQIDELARKIGPTQGDDGQYSDSKLRKMDRDISEIYDTLDEVEYHRNGGILSYGLRNLNSA